MNLVNGEIIESGKTDEILDRLEDLISATLKKPPPDIETIINACDTLVKNIDSLDAMNSLTDLAINPELIKIYKSQIEEMLGGKALRARLRFELGEHFDEPRTLTYSHSGAKTRQGISPLGVIFHITAGNVDGLPFVSVLEGLLTGNINIIKLPKEEGGITASLLLDLFRLEPSLREYVYVFDYSSKDVYALKKLADVADAVVVWGGDEAVSSVRKMVNPNTKIIEWGHKISFAYVTPQGIEAEALEKLAQHICLTNQLFCSSCQGIFLDTEDMQEVYDFCGIFLPILEEACKKSPIESTKAVFINADITLQDYHRQIEGTDIRLFRGENCSIAACPDSRLEPSAMYRNIWVKPLQRSDILRLRPYKGYLQTAALICAGHEHNELSQSLLRAGLVKISDGFEMSGYAFGEAHDGVFALRGYTRITSVQRP